MSDHSCHIDGTVIHETKISGLCNLCNNHVNKYKLFQVTYKFKLHS
jgi:hypothetical protein